MNDEDLDIEEQDEVEHETAEPSQTDLFGNATNKPKPLPFRRVTPVYDDYTTSIHSEPTVDSLVAGVDLDYWVAVAINAQFVEVAGGHTCFADYKAAERADKGAPFAGGDAQLACMFSPSTDWAQGGYVLERHRISVMYTNDAAEPEWYAAIHHFGPEGRDHPYAYGPTPLVAAMRCLLRSVYGELCPGIYPQSQLSHKPDGTVYWRDDPVKLQAWLEEEFRMFPDFKARSSELAHATALLELCPECASHLSDEDLAAGRCPHCETTAQ